MIAALVVNGRKQQKTVFEPCTERVCSLENTKFNESSPRCRNGLFIVCQCACSQWLTDFVISLRVNDATQPSVAAMYSARQTPRRYSSRGVQFFVNEMRRIFIVLVQVAVDATSSARVISISFSNSQGFNQFNFVFVTTMFANTVSWVSGLVTYIFDSPKWCCSPSCLRWMSNHQRRWTKNSRRSWWQNRARCSIIKN